MLNVGKEPTKNAKECKKRIGIIARGFTETKKLSQAKN